MIRSKISSTLAALFGEHSIVFWHDVESEFPEEIDDFAVDGVRVIRIDDEPSLGIKLQIEGAPSQKWLLYSNQTEPQPAKDWLLDVRLRAKTFRADATSMLLEDLGLSSMSLRAHLKERAKFLRAKDRVARLKRLVLPNDTAEDLDRKMLAVVARVDEPELFALLPRIYSAFVTHDVADLSATNKVWQEIVANDLEPAFWALVRERLGYSDPQPCLRDLLVCLFVTDFCRGFAGDAPRQLAHFVLTDHALAASASVFVSQWRSNITHIAGYNACANVVAQELELNALLGSLSTEQLIECMTFEEVELRIVQDLKKRIIDGVGANMDVVRGHISRRRDGHWANPLFASTHEYTKALAACYDALTAAVDFFALKAEHVEGFSFADALAAFTKYRDELFRFDQLYRYFHFAADVVEPTGWAVLHELRESIESAYSGWFIPQLSSAWAKIAEGPQGLLNNWSLSGVTNQQDFYKDTVMPLFARHVKRLFVVISDALRFEVAQELVQQINNKNRLKATLDSMLGVLPSYTALGMAALLPHDSLAYKVSNTAVEVQVDGQMVATLEQRSAVLKNFGGMAVKAEDLMALGKEKGREFVREHQLIYVYHDRIDMIGDKQVSETKTFEAAQQTVGELSDLLGFIVNTLHGSNVLLTADHGFMYQSTLDVADKASLNEKPAGALHTKKRYIIGKDLGQTSQAWCGNTADTAGTAIEGSLDFWVPKGASRFHFVGGARFVHGSAMPQEVVLPLVSVRVNETDSAKIRPVSIGLLGSTNKVVTNTQRFEFIQTDAVAERVLPRTVIVALRDGEALMSDEQTLTFDSTSQLYDERKKSVFLTVLSGNNAARQYYDLVVRDAHTKVEVLRQSVQIDLAFGNDF